MKLKQKKKNFKIIKKKIKKNLKIKKKNRKIKKKNLKNLKIKFRKNLMNQILWFLKMIN